jgi:hypothetical protein
MSGGNEAERSTHGWRRAAMATAMVIATAGGLIAFHPAGWQGIPVAAGDELLGVLARQGLLRLGRRGCDQEKQGRDHHRGEGAVIGRRVESGEPPSR